MTLGVDPPSKLGHVSDQVAEQRRNRRSRVVGLESWQKWAWQ